MTSEAAAELSATEDDAPRYHFVTRWQVAGDVDEVAGLLYDGPGYPRWWPSVYLDVTRASDGDERGVGGAVDLHTKGWLPYHLRWRATITEADLPHSYSLAATGDFVGTGRWTFRQDGDVVDVTYDWDILVQQPLLRRLSFLARPLFSANHDWAMARGLESLRLELDRRHAVSDEARAAVPPPPRAIPDPGPRAIIGVLAVIALVVLTARLAKR